MRQRFAEKDLLATGNTDDYGRYAIDYLEHMPCKLEGPGVSLFVEVQDPDGADPTTVTVRSPVLCPSAPEITVDLDESLQADGRTTWTRLADAMAPHLEGNDYATMPSSVFGGEDIAYLTARTGQDGSSIQAFIAAHRNRAEWSEGPGVNYGTPIPGEAFFAWARAGYDAITKTAPTVRPQQLHAALEAAVDRGDIEAASPADMFAWVAALEETVTLPHMLGQGRALPEVLGLGAFTAAEPDDDIFDFVRQYRNRDPEVEDFWQTYRDHVATEGRSVDVDALVLQLRVAGLVSQHVDTMARVLEYLADAGSGFDDLRDFAAFGPNDWQSFLEGDSSATPPVPAIVPPEHTPGGDLIGQTVNFALALHRSFQLAFPTSSLAHSLVRLQPAGVLLGTSYTDLRDHLVAHPDIDLAITQLEVHNRESSTPPDAATAASLAALQRPRTPERVRFRCGQRRQHLVPLHAREFGPGPEHQRARVADLAGRRRRAVDLALGG